MDDDGSVDDAGRPVLKMRHHDHESGLFWEVIERHGTEEPQAEYLLEAWSKARQLELPFVDAPGTVPFAPDTSSDDSSEKKSGKRRSAASAAT